jgi:predicted methyltransferase
MVRAHYLLATLAGFLITTLTAQAAEHVPSFIAAAVADAGRPQEDKDRDAVRKPAETLAFAGIKKGETVVELIPGRGYFTRILSKAVGPSGHVYVLAPPPRPNAPAGAPDPSAAVKAIAADPAYPNVTVLAFGPAGPGLGVSAPADVVWTSDNYHDFHNFPGSDIATFNKRVFESLKPGGTYLVLDHAAEAGSGVRDTRTLHRIDVAAAKEEVTAAGFKLAGSSDLLHNAQDPHTAAIFDPSIRGHTDQFLLKFTKPK